MAVKRISDIQRFVGLSTDTKPTTGIIDGAEFTDEKGVVSRYFNSTWNPAGSHLLDANGDVVGANNPLSVDGDSVYAKDINISGSDIGTFSGDITDIVDSLSSTISDTSATNPKYFSIKLNRPVNNTSIKFCSPIGSTFSNTKITLKDASGYIISIKDDSSNSTKYTSNTYDWALVPWCTMLVEFHTSDPVSLNWALIEKSKDVHAVLRGQLEDGTFIDIGATISKALKTASLDYSGRQGANTLFNDIIVGMKNASVAIQFQYNISTFDVSTTVVGGTVTQLNSQAVVSSGVGSTNSALIESVRTVRYRPAHEAFAYFTAAFTAGVAGSKQFSGPHSDDDGFFIGYNGTSFGVGFRKATVDTWTPQASFNGEKIDGTGLNRFNLNKTYLNIYRISYGFLGIAPAVFEVYAGFSIGWVVMHTIDFPNTQVGVSINNPVLPIRFNVVKTSGSTDIVIRTGSWLGGTVGDGDRTLGTRPFSVNRNLTSFTAATLTNIFTIKSSAIFQSVTNRITSKLNFLSASSDGNKNVKFYLVKNATLGGTPSYTNVDSVNSVTSYDIAGTTVTGGTIEMTFPIAKIDNALISLSDMNIRIRPGETLTVAVLSAATSDVDCTLRWEEMF